MGGLARQHQRPIAPAPCLLHIAQQPEDESTSGKAGRPRVLRVLEDQGAVLLHSSRPSTSVAGLASDQSPYAIPAPCGAPTPERDTVNHPIFGWLTVSRSVMCDIVS